MLSQSYVVTTSNCSRF